MSHVTLDSCGCIIDNGADGETFTMVYPCDLHTSPHDAIAEARALTVAQAAALADDKQGDVERASDGTMRIVTGRTVHASSPPLRNRAAYVAAIKPINARLKAKGL